MKYGAIGAAVVVFLLALTPVSDFDIWFHLTEGRTIIEEGRFPYTDEYSYTAFGEPSYPNSWGFTALSYVAERAVGLRGLNAIKALAVAALFAVYAAYAYWRRSLSWLWLTYSAVVFFTIRESLSLRPHTFAYVLLAIVLILLEEYRRRRDARLLLPLVVVQFIWVNIHASFLWGITLTVFTLAGIWMQEKRLTKVDIWLGVGVAAVSLLHVFYGYTFIVRLIQEFFTPGAYQVPVRELLAPGIVDVLTLRAGVLIIGIGIVFRLALKKRHYAVMASLIFFTILAARSIRFASDLAIFLVFATALYAPVVEDMVRKRYSWYTKSFARGAAIAICVLLVFAARVMPPRIGNIGLTPFTYPIAAVDFIKQHRLLEESSGNLYNTYNFGGYLMWALPEHPVFIDGRLRPYHNGTFQRYWDNFSGAESWQETVERYSVTVALMTLPHQQQGVLYNSSAAMFLPDTWALIYMDDVAAVYARRTPELADAIATYELHYIEPQQLDMTYIQSRITDEESLQSALDEINRTLELVPTSYRLHFLRAYVFHLAGDTASAKQDLETTLRINPDFTPAQTVLAALSY